MKSNKSEVLKQENPEPEFKEGVDYYFENGMMVLTGHFLRKRGYCCTNGCRHCPYPKDNESPV
jgi:Family of unknown function (DUF5522)